MRGLPIWLPLMFFRVVTACVEMNPLQVPQVWTFRLLDSSCIFRSSEMFFEVIIVIKPYKHFISFHVSFWASSKLILTFTKWGGVACETTSVHGPQCNFRPRNTTSVHGRQLPSTSAPPRYLIHRFQHEWAKNGATLLVGIWWRENKNELVERKAFVDTVGINSDDLEDKFLFNSFAAFRTRCRERRKLPWWLMYVFNSVDNIKSLNGS